MQPSETPLRYEGQARVLVIDDDEGMCYTLTRMAQEEGYRAKQAYNLKDGLQLAQCGEFDVLFLDVRLPDGSGLDMVPRLQSMTNPPEIIIITGYGDQGGAKTALKSGVWDYVEKPARIDALKLSLKRALQYRRQKKTLDDPQTMDRNGIIGQSSKLGMCLVLMSHAAKSQANVLIGGETGTGKELFARAIHKNSQREKRSFVVVDCAALPQNLAESIIFGHTRGAFTGADKPNPGLIKQADGGTLFLDEVGELPPAIQKTFLRVLQEKKFLPVGGQDEVTSSFRLVSATNRDLEREVDEGRFRQDLLYRLRTITIEIPPLRQRRRDIRDIVEHHMAKFCHSSGIPLKKPSSEFLEILEKYDWPGNVRELINAVESALSIEPGTPILYPKHIPEHIRTRIITEASALCNAPGGNHNLPRIGFAEELPSLKNYRSGVIETAEKKYLDELINFCTGDIDKACHVSGLKRARLYQLLKKYGITKGKP
jgi:two-component system NtrC family response regulator